MIIFQYQIKHPAEHIEPKTLFNNALTKRKKKIYIVYTTRSYVHSQPHTSLLNAIPYNDLSLSSPVCDENGVHYTLLPHKISIKKYFIVLKCNCYELKHIVQCYYCVLQLCVGQKCVVLVSATGFS